MRYMKTHDDRYFCTLVSCEKPMSATRLTCYMYILQLAGFELNYKYKITGNGLCSREVESYFNDLAGQGILDSDEHGNIILNVSLDDEYAKLPLTFDSVKLIEEVINFLDGLEYEDLLFLCLTDLTVSDMLQKCTPEEFLARRATVESILKSLSPAFSTENFDVALKVRREIRKGTFKVR